MMLKTQPKFYPIERANEIAKILNENDDFEYRVIEINRKSARIEAHNDDGFVGYWNVSDGRQSEDDFLRDVVAGYQWQCGGCMKHRKATGLIDGWCLACRKETAKLLDTDSDEEKEKIARRADLDNIADALFSQEGLEL